MDHTITTSQVLSIHAGLSKDTSLTPAEVVQGTRTLVHEELQKQSPPPFPLPPADTGKTHEDFAARFRAAASDRERDAVHYAEKVHLAERKAKMMQAVPPETHVAFHAAKGTPAGYGIRDAHHWAQKEHGRLLWEEADRLVALALKGVS